MSNPVIDCPVTALYQDHTPWLRRWLRQKLGCSQQAADIAQDTFMRILVKRDDLQHNPPREPRAFLRVIAGGLVVDHFRRRSLEQAYLEALAASPEPVDISPEERELLLETLHRIDALLDELPAPVRKAFLLSQLDGMTYAEIAEQMQLSLRTIKRYMQQGFSQCIAALL